MPNGTSFKISNVKLNVLRFSWNKKNKFISSIHASFRHLDIATDLVRAQNFDENFVLRIGETHFESIFTHEGVVSFFVNVYIKRV